MISNRSIDKSSANQAGFNAGKRISARRLLPVTGILILITIVAAAVAPVGAISAPSNPASVMQLSAPTFGATADAYVIQSSPTSNYGASAWLDVQGKSRSVQNAYLRFNVSGISGTIQSAKLRVYVSSHRIKNGPAVYLAGNSWTESGSGGITWNSKPALLSGVADNKGAMGKSAWVEYNVASLVKGTGTFTFALVADSSESVTFSSRQGSHPPQLVLSVLANPSPTPTAVHTATPTAAHTATPLAVHTATPTAITPQTKTPTPIVSATHTATPAPSGSIQHVFIVVMENHGYTQVWNTSSSPYITGLGNSYSRATNYHATGHPSLPNYLEMYAGSNFGITTDCSPSSSCHSTARTLADNLEAKGLTWKGYMESMPSPCTLTTSGTYAPKHDPFIYFDDIRTNATRCNSHVVGFSALSSDLASAGTTPNYAFITPNLCSDMHDCSVSTGDTWLKNHLPAILNSPACTVQKCLLALTWDEDDGSQSNHVLTIFAGSGAKTGGATSAVAYTHYSLLRTVETIFGLPTQTSNDAGASPMSDLLK